MKRPIVLLTVLTIFSLAPAESLWATPFINFNSSVVATDGSGPVLICIPSSGAGPCQEAGGNFRNPAVPFYAFKNLDNGSGAATAIGGFASLAGVPPANLTFTFGDLELVNFIGTLTTGTEVYGEGDASPLFFNMFKSGAPIASGTGLVLNVVTDRTLGSPTFGQATGFGSVTLTGGGVEPAFFTRS